MRILTSSVVAVLLACAGPAMATGHDAGTHVQITSETMAIWAYPSQQNYCPAGLQPVTMGGVICCGQPTHVGYKSHPPARKRAAQPYVAYGKGYTEGYTARGKGYDNN